MATDVRNIAGQIGQGLAQVLPRSEALDAVQQGDNRRFEFEQLRDKKREKIVNSFTPDFKGLFPADIPYFTGSAKKIRKFAIDNVDKIMAGDLDAKAQLDSMVNEYFSSAELSKADNQMFNKVAPNFDKLSIGSKKYLQDITNRKIGINPDDGFGFDHSQIYDNIDLNAHFRKNTLGEANRIFQNSKVGDVVTLADGRVLKKAQKEFSRDEAIDLLERDYSQPAIKRQVDSEFNQLSGSEKNRFNNDPFEWYKDRFVEPLVMRSVDKSITGGRDKSGKKKDTIKKVKEAIVGAQEGNEEAINFFKGGKYKGVPIKTMVFTPTDSGGRLKITLYQRKSSSSRTEEADKLVKDSKEGGAQDIFIDLSPENDGGFFELFEIYKSIPETPSISLEDLDKVPDVSRPLSLSTLKEQYDFGGMNDNEIVDFYKKQGFQVNE